MSLRGISKAETAVLLLVLTLLLSMFTLWQQRERAQTVVLSRTVENASVLSQIARSAHAQYSDTVRSVVGSDVTMTTQSQLPPGSLHFPATFTRMMLERFSSKYPGAQFGVYSNDPFETQRERELDPFTRDAITALQEPGTSEFWDIVPFRDGTYKIRYATPIHMQESCVECHNRPEWGLKKNDWAPGDLRGVWEVMLDVPVAALHMPAQFQSLIALHVFACILGLLLVFPAVQREVAQRTYFENLSSDLNILAETDELSGLANRRAFGATIEAIFRDPKPDKPSYGLIIIDIDHFKRVNDTYGHGAGDDVIRQISQVISKHVRPNDLCARYGGEEFAVVCPDVSYDELAEIASRIRAMVELSALDAAGTKINITVSVGVTILHDDDDQHSFFQRADRQLYKAKASGRNKVMLA